MRKLKLSDIITSVTDIRHGDIQVELSYWSLLRNVNHSLQQKYPLFQQKWVKSEAMLGPGTRDACIMPIPSPKLTEFTKLFEPFR